MRLRKKSPLERVLKTVGDSLEAVSDVKPGVPDMSSGGARKAGLIAAASAVALTAGSAGISSLRRRRESAHGDS